MIQSSIHGAMQSLAPNFDRLQTQITGLGPNFERLQHQITGLSVRDTPMTGTESTESRRQDILNQTMRESQASARETLRSRYAEASITVTDADLDGMLSRSGQNSTRDNIQKMRVDDLPKFDGTDVHGFVVNIMSALVQFDQQAVARTIPRAFEGQARNWWNILTDDTKSLYMGNVYRFKDVLEEEFADSIGVAKDKAKSRVWRVGSEDIMTYYYDKMDLMVNANHGNHSDVEVCYELREGLPIEFRPYIRTVLERNPSTQRMRKEFQTLENDFMKMWKSSKRFTTPPLTPARSPSYSPSSASTERSPSPVFRRSRTEPPLRESYDPKKVGQHPGPDGKMMRSYTLPSGQLILLNRTCRVSGCNGNHFDFEHDYLSSSKKRAQSIPARDSSEKGTYEGYPISTEHGSFPTIDEESSEDEEEHGMKLLSYPMGENPDEGYTYVNGPRFYAKRRGTKN